MQSRCKYTPEDDRRMWQYVIDCLKKGEKALKGNALWQRFVDTIDSSRTATNFSSHYRKQLLPLLAKADLPLEDILYIHNELDLAFFDDSVFRYRCQKKGKMDIFKKLKAKRRSMEGNLKVDVSSNTTVRSESAINSSIESPPKKKIIICNSNDNVKKILPQRRCEMKQEITEMNRKRVRPYSRQFSTDSLTTEPRSSPLPELDNESELSPLISNGNTLLPKPERSIWSDSEDEYIIQEDSDDSSPKIIETRDNAKETSTAETEKEPTVVEAADDQIEENNIVFGECFPTEPPETLSKIDGEHVEGRTDATKVTEEHEQLVDLENTENRHPKDIEIISKGQQTNDNRASQDNDVEEDIALQQSQPAELVRDMSQTQNVQDGQGLNFESGSFPCSQITRDDMPVVYESIHEYKRQFTEELLDMIDQRMDDTLGMNALIRREIFYISVSNSTEAKIKDKLEEFKKDFISLLNAARDLSPIFKGAEYDFITANFEKYEKPSKVENTPISENARTLNLKLAYTKFSRRDPSEYLKSIQRIYGIERIAAHLGTMNTRFYVYIMEELFREIELQEKVSQ